MEKQELIQLEEEFSKAAKQLYLRFGVSEQDLIDLLRLSLDEVQARPHSNSTRI